MSDRRMFSEDLALVMIGQKHYRPSNGSEGMAFQDRWCDQCTKDFAGPEQGCPIIVKAMVFDEEDAGYPPEWTYDEHGQPCCTAFDAAKPK